ncbi:hypothetical protein D3C72_729110 [compost metagenome]
MSKAAVVYKGFKIYYDPKPIPTNKLDWNWVHDDFDGAPDSNDRRCGSAESIDACIVEIDDLIEDMEE